MARVDIRKTYRTTYALDALTICARCIGGEVKEIPLTKGQVALVDDEDYATISAYRWFAFRPCPSTGFYARRSTWIMQRKRGVSMHRQIIGQSCEGALVDHKDGNGLNNCRSNLRIVNHSQSVQNRRKTVGHVGYKGVGPSGGKWKAKLQHHGREFYLGTFQRPEEAARAYDAKAREVFGEFACVNFPNAGERSAARG
jgi:hypothetical protein